MRPLELQRQFLRVQILPDMGQALFQLQQGMPDVLLVGESDVAPHGVGTARNARHLAQGAATSLEQGSVLAIFIDQRSGQSRRDELRQMADPAAKLIMRVGVHAGYSCAYLLYPPQKFPTQALEHFLSRSRRHKPYGALEEIRVGGVDSRLFLPGHGMSSQESAAGVLAEGRGCAGQNF